MNVSLTAELEKWVQDRVDSGLYTSASEVVREALRLLRERDDLRAAATAELRQDVAVGLRQLDAGEGRPFDRAEVERIKLNARRRHGKRDA